MIIYTNLREIESIFNFTDEYREEFLKVTSVYPFRISCYLLSKIRRFSKDDPIFRQFFPDIRELDTLGELDPFSEEDTTGIPFLIRRYQDRLLVVTTNFCYSYCRFCMRKRNWLKPTFFFDDLSLLEDYIKRNSEIRDVILSGGDALALNNELLEDYLKLLRRLDIPIIRIGSRALVNAPDVLYDKIGILRKYAPIWINFHVNHPVEIDDNVSKVALELTKCGIIMGSQTVLLSSVNDDVDTLSELFRKLVYIGIRPYYLFSVDPVIGVDHFRVDLRKAIKIVRDLRNKLSGLMIPHFAVDTRYGKRILP